MLGRWIKVGGKNDKEIIRLLIIRWNNNLKKKKKENQDSGRKPHKKFLEKWQEYSQASCNAKTFTATDNYDPIRLKRDNAC